MQLKDFQKLNIPSDSGVYTFMGKGARKLYIGKATNLKARVRSYFDNDLASTRGEHIVRMVEEARTVRFETTDSVLEALLKEAQYIKKHRPLYNTKEKDDKSFNYVVITKEEFPRVLIIRGKELYDPKHKPDFEISDAFGPFPAGRILKDALKIIRKIFPFRDKCTPGQGKPCFNRQIGLCPGVCTGEISKSEYAKTIRHIKLFFEGKKKTLIGQLTKEMNTHARKKEFEKAQEVKKTIFALEHIHDIALIKDDTLRGVRGFRIEGYDVAHTSGKDLVGVMTVVESGDVQKQEYRKFKIKSFEGVNDTKALSEILDRRLGHMEWPLPRLIVVDGGAAQINAATKVLKNAGVEIPVVGVVKDERHKPKMIRGGKRIISQHENAILLVNNEAHRFAIGYHRKKRGKIA